MLGAGFELLPRGLLTYLKRLTLEASGSNACMSYILLMWRNSSTLFRSLLTACECWPTSKSPGKCCWDKLNYPEHHIWTDFGIIGQKVWTKIFENVWETSFSNFFFSFFLHLLGLQCSSHWDVVVVVFIDCPHESTLLIQSLLWFSWISFCHSSDTKLAWGEWLLINPLLPGCAWYLLCRPVSRLFLCTISFIGMMFLAASDTTVVVEFCFGRFPVWVKWSSQYRSWLNSHITNNSYGRRDTEMSFINGKMVIACTVQLNRKINDQHHVNGCCCVFHCIP